LKTRFIDNAHAQLAEAGVLDDSTVAVQPRYDYALDHNRMRDHMKPVRIGDFEVHALVEFAGGFIAPEPFFPDFDPEVLRANPDMIGPQFVEPATGKLVFSFHCFVVNTGKHTILIDSCIGNDKERPTRPQFHRLKTPFLADLAKAGVQPESIDY